MLTLALSTMTLMAAGALAGDGRLEPSPSAAPTELAAVSETTSGQDASKVAEEAESTAPALPDAIALRVTGPAIDGAVAEESPSHLGGALQIHNVTRPTLTPFLPPREIATGTAVIIAPGGSFISLSIESEGYQEARWLASKGIAAFVLKYRLIPTPPSALGLTAETLKLFSLSPEKQMAHVRLGETIATPDAAEAIRVVRSRSREWGVDPRRVGLMGFSAGAMIAIDLTLKADSATRPDFILPIYGLISTPDQPVPKKLPPMWTALASDDPLVGKTDFGLISAWRNAGAEVELHYFEKGGHGFGFDGKSGTTSVHWRDELYWWLEARQLLGSQR